MFIYISKKGRRYNQKKSIYDWMDELDDYNEQLVFQLIRINNKRNSIENLNIIKGIILNQSYRKLEDLKLYKAFYINIAKESAEELYFKSALAFLSSIGVYLLKDPISQATNINISNGFLTAILLFITIAVLSGKLTENKKRAGLIIGILDLCIDEIEKEKQEIQE